MSACSEGGILKHNQLLTEKEVKQVYKSTDHMNSVKLNVSEVTEDENMYQKGIIANIDKKKETKPLESWSILSDHVKYVQYDEYDNLHNVNFDSLNYHINEDIYKELKEQELLKASIDFSGMSEKVKSDYLDVYDGVYAEVKSTKRFDEDTDLSTTYITQIDISRKTEVKAEESFTKNAAGHTRGLLLGGTECEILRYWCK